VRTLYPLAVLVFFGVMMTLLARDHVLPDLRGEEGSRLSAAMLADQWTGRDEWARVSLGRAPVGVLHTTSYREGDTFASAMQLRLDSTLVKGDVRAVATANERLELEAIHVVLDFSAYGIKPAEVSGLVVGGELLLKLETGDGVRHTQVPLKRPLTLNTAADSLLASEQMVAGETYFVDVYDPLWGMQPGRLRMVMTGEERIPVGDALVPTRRVEATMGNVVTRVWTDRQGRQVRREIGFGTPEDNEQRGGGIPMPFTGGPRITLDLLDSREAVAAHPELAGLPPLPRFSADDLRGRDTGEPLESFGLLPVIVRGRFGGESFLAGPRPDAGEEGS